MKRALAVIAVVFLAALLLWGRGLLSGEPVGESDAVPPSSSAAGADGGEPEGEAEEGEDDPAGGSDHREEAEATPGEQRREIRRAVADVFRARVAEAREVRVARVQRSVPPDPDEDAAGTLDAEYIQDAVQAVRPLLQECYELALDAVSESGEDAPEGRLLARFVISGEPDVGGVVEESEILEESEIHHPVLDECFQQTLYTLELPAPEDGGRVTVNYPFTLRNDDE